jgi:integrase
LRRGELVRAQSTDIQNGSLVVHQTKSGKIRRVPLSPELLAELRFKVGRLIPLTDGTGFSRQVRRLTGIGGSTLIGCGTRTCAGCWRRDSRSRQFESCWGIARWS